MSGYLGLQGRYATGFGYGPKLGVGRYPAFERGALSNALLQAAGDYGYGQPPGNGGGTAVNEDIVRAPELLAPASPSAAPQAIPLPGLAPISGQALDAASGGGNGLLQYLPAALGMAAPYALKKIKELIGGDPTPLNNPYTPLAGDYTTNIAMGSGEGTPGGISGIAPQSIVTMGSPSGLGIFAPDTVSTQIASANTLTPDLPMGLDNSTLGPAFGGGDVGSINFSNFGDASGVGSFGPPDLGGGGFNLDLSGLADPSGWSVNTGTGTFGLGAGVDLGGGLSFNVDPVGIAGSVLGSWGGSKLATSLVRGDQQDQPRAEKIGGSIGGIAGTIIGGPIGGMIGSFLGALGGGTIFAGSPDDPYSYIGANVGYGDTGPQLNWWSPNGMNFSDPKMVNGLAGALQPYIEQQARQGGYTLNPEMINRQAFSAGYTDNPDGGKYFVGGTGVSPSQAAYDGMQAWRGDDPNQIAPHVWDTLVANNVYTKGPTTPWQDVWAQVSQPVAMYDNSGQVTSYTTPDQNQWFAPAPVDNSWLPQGSTAQPAYDPGMYDQIGAGG